MLITELFELGHLLCETYTTYWPLSLCNYFPNTLVRTNLKHVSPDACIIDSFSRLICFTAFLCSTFVLRGWERLDGSSFLLIPPPSSLYIQQCPHSNSIKILAWLHTVVDYLANYLARSLQVKSQCGRTRRWTRQIRDSGIFWILLMKRCR